MSECKNKNKYIEYLIKMAKDTRISFIDKNISKVESDGHLLFRIKDTIFNIYLMKYESKNNEIYNKFYYGKYNDRDKIIDMHIINNRKNKKSAEQAGGADK